MSETLEKTEIVDNKSTVSDDISHENDIIKNLMNTQATDYYEKKHNKSITDKKRFNNVENYY